MSSSLLRPEYNAQLFVRFTVSYLHPVPDSDGSDCHHLTDPVTLHCDNSSNSLGSIKSNVIKYKVVLSGG